MNPTKHNAVKMKNTDNVATAVLDLSKGEVGAIKLKKDEYETVKLINNIPFGHKFALSDMPKGSLVIKYGEEIGLAVKDIKAGEHVHVHNVDSVRGKGTTTT